MKIWATDEAQTDALVKAFHEREKFILMGAGMTAFFVAETLNKEPCPFRSGDRVINLELTQVSYPDEVTKWTDGYISVPAGTGRTLADWRPSIGTTCEALHKSGQWVRVTILDRMVGSPSCACRDENDRLWWATEFRRTTDAARTKACDEMFGVILKLPEDRRHNRSDIVEALYDAGYRKFEIVS